MEVYIVIPICVLVLAFFFAGLRMDKEYQRGVIFRLGRLKSCKGPGLYWIIPFFDRRVRVDLRVSIINIDSQEVVTRDSVTVKINAILYYKITRPERVVVIAHDYEQAIIQIAVTTLKNVIGQHTLEEILSDRKAINRAMKANVDVVAGDLGLMVKSIEMKDIDIPVAMQKAMAKEAQAMRERRARIIKADGEYQASLKLKAAAEEIESNPIALELRRIQMVTEVSSDQNTRTLVMPSDFVEIAKTISNGIESGILGSGVGGTIHNKKIQENAQSGPKGPSKASGAGDEKAPAVKA